MTRPAAIDGHRIKLAAATVSTPAIAYVGIGGNLGDRVAILRSAVEVFARGWIPGTRLLRCSPAFETRPVGPSRFPFLNAAVELATSLAPIELLDALLAIERSHGREREVSKRWTARTLDLDLLAYLPHEGAETLEADEATGSLFVTTPRLQLPHPELANRDFVLTPLACLVPGLRPTGGATIEELLVRLPEGDRTIMGRWPAPLHSPATETLATASSPERAAAEPSPLPSVTGLVAPPSPRGIDARDDSG